jgi:hypothetical protein
MSLVTRSLALTPFLELIVLAPLAPKTFPDPDGSFLAATALRLGGTPRPPAAAPGRERVASARLVAGAGWGP